MSYTNVKVSYIGTSQDEVDAEKKGVKPDFHEFDTCLLYTSPSPRDLP